MKIIGFCVRGLCLRCGLEFFCKFTTASAGVTSAGQAKNRMYSIGTGLEAEFYVVDLCVSAVTFWTRIMSGNPLPTTVLEITNASS